MLKSCFLSHGYITCDCLLHCAALAVRLCAFMNTHLYMYAHEASAAFQLSFSIGHGQFPEARICSPPKQWGAAFALLVNEGKQTRSGGQLRAVDIAPWLPVVLGRASLSQGLLGRERASLGSSCQCWGGEGERKESRETRACFCGAFAVALKGQSAAVW